MVAGIGTNVIADGREQEVVIVKQLTKRSGSGIIVRLPQILFVELPEEVHVLQGRDRRPRGWKFYRG
jgi:hypothetical protein